MGLPFRQLRPGHYLVLRRFGKSRLYKVVGVPEYGRWRGWHIHVRYASLLGQTAEERAYRYLVMRGLARPGRVFRAPFYVRLYPWLDLVFGRPRWDAFSEVSAVREHVALHPDYDLFDLFGRIVARCLPRRAAAWTVLIVATIAYTLSPIGRLPFRSDEEL